MSAIKRYIEQCEAEDAMNDWIRERVDVGVEEGDPEWEEMKEEYLSGLSHEEYIWDEDFYEDEFIRLSSDVVAFSQFNSQMSILKEELPENPSDSTIKMAYSYSMTLMETCLGDMIKSLILNDEHYLRNAIDKVDELGKIRLSLKEVYSNPDIVKKMVIKTFSDYLYHNVEKIVPIYSAVIGEKTPEDVKSKMPEIIEITKIRHDIVHRNGVDKDGNVRDLTVTVLLAAMNNIYDFVKSMSSSINVAELNRRQTF